MDVREINASSRGQGGASARGHIYRRRVRFRLRHCELTVPTPSSPGLGVELVRSSFVLAVFHREAFQVPEVFGFDPDLTAHWNRGESNQAGLCRLR